MIGTAKEVMNAAARNAIELQIKGDKAKAIAALEFAATIAAGIKSGKINAKMKFGKE